MSIDFSEVKANSFLEWAIVHLMPKEDTKFAKISQASNNFKNLELDIKINGVEVDSVKFLNSINHALDYEIKRGVANRISDIEEFIELEDLVNKFNTEIKNKMREVLVEAGIDLVEFDED